MMIYTVLRAFMFEGREYGPEDAGAVGTLPPRVIRFYTERGYIAGTPAAPIHEPEEMTDGSD